MRWITHINRGGGYAALIRRMGPGEGARSRHENPNHMYKGFKVALKAFNVSYCGAYAKAYSAA